MINDNFEARRKMTYREQLEYTLQSVNTGVLQAIAEVMLKDGRIVCHCNYADIIKNSLGKFLYDSMEILRDRFNDSESDNYETVDSAMDDIADLANSQYTLVHERDITRGFKNGTAWMSTSVKTEGGCVDEGSLLSTTFFILSWLISHYKSQNAMEISEYLRDGSYAHNLSRVSFFGSECVNLQRNYGKAAENYMKEYAASRFDNFLYAVAGFVGTPSPEYMALTMNHNPNGGGELSQYSLRSKSFFLGLCQRD